MKLNNLRRNQLKNLFMTLLGNYKNYFNEDELQIIYNLFCDFNDGMSLEEAENIIEPMVRKVWNLDLSSGDYKVISWNKYAGENNNALPVIFATISKKEDLISFCDMEQGIAYDITYDSLIGALQKDGATLIEDKNRMNQYTLGVLEDKVINSYNGATKFITPFQLVSEDRDNDYRSKHNELILDRRYIKKIEEVQKR